MSLIVLMNKFKIQNINCMNPKAYKKILIKLMANFLKEKIWKNKNTVQYLFKQINMNRKIWIFSKNIKKRIK